MGIDFLLIIVNICNKLLKGEREISIKSVKIAWEQGAIGVYCYTQRNTRWYFSLSLLRIKAGSI